MKIYFLVTFSFFFFGDEVCTFDDYLREGLIEYLDVNEENNALVCLQLNCLMFFDYDTKTHKVHLFQTALYEGEATPETTHIEIEPFTIF